jgi:hypothetical protein
VGAVTVLPGDVRTYTDAVGAGSGIQVRNVSDRPRQVNARLEITSLRDSRYAVVVRRSLSLAARSYQSAVFGPIEVDSFRDRSPEASRSPTRYRFRVEILEGARLIDEASFDFEIGPTPAQAAQIQGVPITCNRGETISITGTGFGNVQGESNILFNGEAVTVTQWNNNFIRVQVPDQAPSVCEVVVQTRDAQTQRLVQSNMRRLWVGPLMPIQYSRAIRIAVDLKGAQWDVERLKDGVVTREQKEAPFGAAAHTLVGDTQFLPIEWKNNRFSCSHATDKYSFNLYGVMDPSGQSILVLTIDQTSRNDFGGGTYTEGRRRITLKNIPLASWNPATAFYANYYIKGLTRERHFTSAEGFTRTVVMEGDKLKEQVTETYREVTDWGNSAIYVYFTENPVQTPQP